jgi:hypothetical protein
MILPAGAYRLETRERDRLIAVETGTISAAGVAAARQVEGSDNRYEAAAELDESAQITALQLRYVRGPFARSARYELGPELMRGMLKVLAGYQAVEVKLGRFREVDGGLLIFKALLVAHARGRGLRRWTGRVAIIDPATLLAKSIKQTLYQTDEAGLEWVLEPALGEREVLRIDSQGRLLSHATHQGLRTLAV